MTDKKVALFSGVKRGKDYILVFQREKSIAWKNENVINETMLFRDTGINVESGRLYILFSWELLSLLTPYDVKKATQHNFERYI